MFKKVLIANRGEIAVRIIRACRELGIKTVAVHSEADTGALHTRLADEAVCIGPAPALKSYLNTAALISTAEITGADAIHPGYGFLSENAQFAEVVGRCNITFIGPSPEAMRAWGDKVTARENAKRYGLPMLPGTGVLRGPGHAIDEANRVGYPVILKSSGGGGGRGMRVVRGDDDMRRAFESAQAEAKASFNNPDIYLEKFLEEPRHIEFQVLADRHGQVWTLGERECSLQRRNQKVIEEAPSPVMSEEIRRQIGELLRKAMRETDYATLATVEFLMDDKKNLYFMEVNTRLQVEHPVTEQVTSLDLVELQIRAAAGEKLDLPDTRPWNFRGHAIECRINAEDPITFGPWPGLITEYPPPGGAGVRVDSGIYGGFRVPPNYDSMLAKVICHGRSRIEAIKRMERALDEFIVGGVRTNIALHKRLLADPEIRAGNMSTRSIERIIAQPPGQGFMSLKQTTVGDLHADVFTPEGHSKGVVVLIHGACTGGRLWHRWAEKLAQRGLETWCPDLRGHGKSTGQDQLSKASIEDYAADVQALLGKSGGQAVVGHDVGGILAQLVASRTPLRGMVLVNTIAPKGIGGAGSVLEIWRQIFRPRILRAILKGASWSYTKDEIESLSAGKLSPEECAEFSSWLGPESGVASREVAIAGVTVDERKISCPALVVASTFDSLTPPARQRLIASRYRADYVEFAQHAHFPMLEPGWERPVAVVGRWLEEAARLNGEVRGSVGRISAARRSATGTPIPGTTPSPIPGAVSPSPPPADADSADKKG